MHGCGKINKTQWSWEISSWKIKCILCYYLYTKKGKRNKTVDSYSCSDTQGSYGRLHKKLILEAVSNKIGEGRNLNTVWLLLTPHKYVKVNNELLIYTIVKTEN